MRGAAAVVMAAILAVTGCYNWNRAEVRPGRNPAGDRCFESCRSNPALSRGELLRCVSACPGVELAETDCGSLPGCVDTRSLSVGQTVLATVGITAVALTLVGLIVVPLVFGGLK